MNLFLSVYEAFCCATPVLVFYLLSSQAIEVYGVDLLECIHWRKGNLLYMLTSCRVEHAQLRDRQKNKEKQKEKVHNGGKIKKLQVNVSRRWVEAGTEKKKSTKKEKSHTI